MESSPDDDYEMLQAALAIIAEWDDELKAPAVETGRDERHSDAVSPSSTTDSDVASSSSQSFASSPPLVSTAATGPTKKSRRRKVRSGEEAQPTQMQRRDELVFLRDKVHELESQLQQIKENGSSTVVGDSADTKQPTQERALDPMSMDGVRIHHETVTRVVWADGCSESTTTEGRLAMIQMSTSVHIQFAAAETATRRRRVGALTNYAMFAAESEITRKQQLMEDLLLRNG